MIPIRKSHGRSERGLAGYIRGAFVFFILLFLCTFLPSLLLVVNSPLTALFFHDSSHGLDDGMSFYKAKRGVGVRSFGIRL